MKHLIYLGNVFHIENCVITITPMKSRIEAIQKLPPPTTVKRCKSFLWSCQLSQFILQRPTEHFETYL